ncbi:MULTISPECIES: hypothetical protein [unclassified Brevibacterium]|uniref:hypothetical protein n=1 Tax=unclassified Brevibacterium TaxID=2614124 RepID=UPI0008A25A8B|nr:MULTISPECIES: hypothetical protein [unclassified Brevibacterium]OFL68527.1 hypothetical protein HMPREF2757_08635 [Brevibacterium sp. HMSC063G07]OFS26683.1 hypothetical protein HMPREF3162_05005 [Brevibacterium sp. HMSC07C04]
MDALMLINTHESAVPVTPLIQLLDKARMADGVIAYVTAPAEQSAFAEPIEGADPVAAAPTADDLILASPTLDAFESYDDLALGLQDMGIERLIVAGADSEPDAEGRGAVWATAAAALAHQFSVVFAETAVVLPDTGDRPAWMHDALQLGAVEKPAEDIWLKM